MNGFNIDFTVLLMGCIVIVVLYFIGKRLGFGVGLKQSYVIVGTEKGVMVYKVSDLASKVFTKSKSLPKLWIKGLAKFKRKKNVEGQSRGIDNPSSKVVDEEVEVVGSGYFSLNNVKIPKGARVYFAKEGFPQTVNLFDLFEGNASVEFGEGNEKIKIHLDEDTLGKANNETVLGAFMKSVKLSYFRILLYMSLGWLVFGYVVKIIFAIMGVPYDF